MRTRVLTAAFGFATLPPTGPGVALGQPAFKETGGREAGPEKAKRKGTPPAGSGAAPSAAAAASKVPAGLPDGLASAIVETAEEKILFPTNRFPSVRVGDEFYVLTPKRDGLMARVRVSELGSSGMAIAVPVEGGRGFRLEGEGLPELRVIRVVDAEPFAERLSKGPLAPSAAGGEGPALATPAAGSSANPLVAAGVGGTLGTLEALDLFSGRASAPRSLRAGVRAEAFLPHASALGNVAWMNWIGVRASFETASAQGVPLVAKGVSGEEVSQGTAEWEELAVTPLVRAWFDSRYVSRVGLSFDAMRNERATLAAERALGASIASRVPTLGVEFESQPFAGVLLGLAVRKGIGGKSEVKRDAAGFETRSSHASDSMAVDGSIGSRVITGALPHALGIEVVAGATWASRSFAGAKDGRGDLGRSQWRGRLGLSAGWIP